MQLVTWLKYFLDRELQFNLSYYILHLNRNSEKKNFISSKKLLQLGLTLGYAMLLVT